MKISVLGLFRDSEKHIRRTLQQFETLVQYTSADISFHFYENDSVDKTPAILSDWLEFFDGTLISESLGKPKFGQVTDQQRMMDLVEYRNKLLDAVSPLDSDFTLLVDTDVIFSGTIINEYLDIFKNNPEIVMITPNILQDIKCKMENPKKDSYYDSWALIDSYNTNGLTWSSNPFITPPDRQAWEEGDVVKVMSAFGGCPIIKTDVLNKCRWNTTGGCEHWLFCEEVRQYGDIVVTPNVTVKVKIGDRKFSNEDQVIMRQKKILDLHRKFHEKGFSVFEH